MSLPWADDPLLLALLHLALLPVLPLSVDAPASPTKANALIGLTAAVPKITNLVAD